MHRGYIKYWRKTMDSRHASRGIKHVGLFSSFLLRANRKEGWFLGEKIGPGQYGTSKVAIAEWAKVTPKVLRKLLADLEEDGLITCQNRANRFTLITICNWATYQEHQDDEGQTKDKPRANLGHQVDPLSENDKKEENTETGVREKLSEHFKNFLDAKGGMFSKNPRQREKWRAVWNELRANEDVELAPIFEWACLSYQGSIGSPRFFCESIWPKIKNAYANTGKKPQDTNDGRMTDQAADSLREYTKNQ